MNVCINNDMGGGLEREKAKHFCGVVVVAIVTCIDRDRRKHTKLLTLLTSGWYKA